jgi:crotonobetainyl-CoA:carnitine CoA-transferase CaiB-like acyl-CoA transferase
VQEFDRTFAQHSLAEWRVKLADADGVWAPMQNIAELLHDPQVQANGYLVDVDRGDGTSFALVANPVQFDEQPPALTPAPDLGQHTEDVLLAMGMTWEDLARLKEAGAIS